MNWLDNICVSVSIFGDIIKKIFCPFFKLEIKDREVYLQLQNRIINCCDNILKASPNDFLRISEKELTELQGIKLEVNINIKDNKILELLEELINAVGELNTFEIIIKDSINNSVNEKEAVNSRCECLKVISKLRTKIGTVFRNSTISKGFIICKK